MSPHPGASQGGGPRNAMNKEYAGFRKRNGSRRFLISGLTLGLRPDLLPLEEDVGQYKQNHTGGHET